MEIDDFRKLVELTPEQRKAWNRLARAHKDFVALGGKYYTCLDTVRAYNGNHISHVENGSLGDDLDVSNYYLPSISDEGFAGFADDTHVFVLDVDL